MKASDLLIGKIKEFEGFSSTAYTCPAGKATIGHGHTRGVKITDRCTRSEAERWLREDLAPVEAYVNKIGQVKTQGQFDALVDFAYNLGLGKLESSTLLRKIKAGAPVAEIQAQFRRWVYAKGKVLKGLVKRREWEARRFAE